MSNAKKVRLLKTYATVAKSLKAYPTIAELGKAGVSRNTLRHHFGTHEAFKDAARSAHPNFFDDVLDPSLFSAAIHDAVQEEAKKYKRFVITTAISGHPVHKGLLASMKKYCELNKALMLVIPADYALQSLSKELAADTDLRIVFRTLHLNSNICVNPIKIDPKQVDPATGLDSFGQSETVIIGSPKQRRVAIANSNSKLARVIQATGAVTRANYVPRDGIPKRRDTLAERHHRMGGVIVEVVDNKLYHFRHFEMSKDGSFNDLFENYSPQGKKHVGCVAIIQGDKHCGDTDPEVNAAVDQMCSEGTPKYRIEHDFFNGASISHHSQYNQIERAIMAKQDKISLEKELKITADELRRVQKLGTAQTHVIVESNHNDWLNQYLNKGSFTDENRHMAVKLQDLAMTGEHPLKAAMEQIMKVKSSSGIKWLGVDDDFRVAGVELGAHGHLGANGKRNPGCKGMYRAYGKVMFGHVHHAEIFHDAMSVGTSTFLKLGYNRGASSWDQSQGILYADGTRQLVNVIKGKWRL